MNRSEITLPPSDIHAVKVDDGVGLEAANDTGMTASRKPVFAPWTAATQWVHGGMTKAVVASSLFASRRPKTFVYGISFLSLALITVGFFTNFELVLEFDAVFTPTGSQPAMHKDWVYSDEGFPDTVRKIALMMHKDGGNVLTTGAMERVFLGVDTIRDTEGYNELCLQGTYIDFEGVKTCRVLSATGYFDHHELDVFQEQVHSDEELRQALSPFEFANGSPVYHDSILGNWKKDATGNLTSAQSFLVTVEIPDVDDSNAFESKMLERLDDLRREWSQKDEESGDKILEMDIITIYAYEVEYQRAIEADLWLVPLVGIMMCSFVAVTFASYGFGHVHAKSRTLLGALAVLTISMSFMAGTGLMFLCGVPFTSITQILPFVIFGIGLDDTYIIAGAYFRTDPTLDVLERIRITMVEVAHSISLTTITTIFAFLLGLMSSLPGVRWLCMYAFTTIFIDFVFQITLFPAFIVLDERRIQAKKRDCCFWLPEKQTEDDEEVQEDSTMPAIKDAALETEGSAGSTTSSENSETCTKSIPERIMSTYAEILLRPHMKALVLVLFGALFGCCAYSATLLTQEFKVGDFVPDDSYLRDVLNSFENYASVVRPIAVYFRNIDQTDPDMQAQMVQYVNDLESLEELSSSTVNLTGVDGAPATDVKPFCWVRDFQQLATEFSDQPEFAFIQNLTFIEQLNLALAQPTVREIYGQDIVRDESGNITASRCWLFLTDIDLDSVEAQIDLLHKQRAVGATQPANLGKPKGGWSFFFFDEMLFYWEAYDVSVKELYFTVVSGVVALTVIAFVLIPHWTAVCFVTPMIVMLYVNFLGTLQFFGLHINGIFYICVVVSVGLLVDFLLHILMRYYETSPDKTRNERVKETLETMGASIMLGGLTTFLGIVPLCISSTKIFMTVFLAFFGMVVLGIAHGLILLPVILSLVGPRTGLVALHSSSNGHAEVLAADSEQTKKRKNTHPQHQSTMASFSTDSIKQEASSSHGNEAQVVMRPPLGKATTHGILDDISDEISV
ncbi:Pick C1-like protein 1 [Seminavis robusta]|uniref:Pick C1-like protein 1 n=1 Tax=Seminavis robusta TaxID=568900 RepID=A0A9N8DV75_9STRA|nr:Pick C1-like protein 1 [Seminavis robusta]|eukprot:Sro318_g115890.1 Pick C1-like protein 1 (1018) ;mRNA; r:20043-23533